MAVLLRGITKYHDFYFLNCLHSFAKESENESQRNVDENKDFF